MEDKAAAKGEMQNIWGNFDLYTLTIVTLSFKTKILHPRSMPEICLRAYKMTRFLNALLGQAWHGSDSNLSTNFYLLV